MSNSPFQLLFLGEDLAWSKLLQALAPAPRGCIKTHRAQSLNELFLVLAGGHWHAIAIDVHAWNLQGLHYVESVRSEYPSLPILAIYPGALNDLEDKALHVGASQAIALESLDSDNLLSAILSTLADPQSGPHSRRDSNVQLTFNIAEQTSPAATRTQAISHALNNLLCVITANADLLAEHVSGSSTGEHSLTEIKKAAKSASDLMRQLK